MVLTKAERDKFIEYCTRQVESAKAIGEQMENLTNGLVGTELAKRERATAAAYLFVARDLASLEEMSIG